MNTAYVVCQTHHTIIETSPLPPWNEDRLYKRLCPGEGTCRGIITRAAIAESGRILLWEEPQLPLDNL